MEKNLLTKLILLILIGIISTNYAAAQTATAPTTGNGTAGNPYQIATWQNLIFISQNSNIWDKHYIQTSDITFPDDINTWNSGAGFNSIGDGGVAFTGSYNGDGNTITGLFINRPEYFANIGFFGRTDGATIQKLGLVNVNITGSDRVGGGVGTAGPYSIISQVYSTGTVNGSGNSVGGLIGLADDGCNITNSYSSCSVGGTGNRFGGLIGSTSGFLTISKCYAIGAVANSTQAGGLVANGDYGVSENCFWDNNATGQTTSFEGTGKSATAMKDIATFTLLATAGLSSAWDFVGTENNDTGTEDIWTINGVNNNGYPYLSWQTFGPAPVAEEPDLVSGVYQIATWQNLYWISQNPVHWDKHYKQTADIDFADATPAIGTWDSNKGWTPIGNSTTPFTGTYNGGGHTIDGLFIDRPAEDYVGLFGKTSSTSVISNLGVINVNITGKGSVGGLIGDCEGAINQCFTTGAVSGSGIYVGGLVGNFGNFDPLKNGNGTISDCYARCSVSGSGNFFGGLIGNTLGGTISNCYATGSVDVVAKVGGLIAQDYATTTNSFWDNVTTGQTVSAGGTGKSTPEMKNITTFTDHSTVGLTSAWDFVGTENDDTGTEDIWKIDGVNNDGYPYLSWQNFGPDYIFVKADATGNNDGSSWENAFLLLQSALNAAVSGNQIWVAAGTYLPTTEVGGTGDRYKSFQLKNGVAIYGGFAGTEDPATFDLADRNFVANETILSGDHAGNDNFIVGGGYQGTTGVDNSYHVFYHPFADKVDNTAILNGFTITGGNANFFTDGRNFGGGFHLNSSNPALSNLIINKNYAGDGGGIYVNGISASTPLILSNILLTSNRALRGGAIRNLFSTIEFNNSSIVNNAAISDGGALQNNNSTSHTTFNNCIIAGNNGHNGKQFHINNGSVTLNYSRYSNETGDNTGTGTLNVANNNITDSPKFVDETSGDYRIVGTSPCVDSGNNSYNTEPKDIRGEDRVQGGTIDMGAYEWTSGVDPASDCKNPTAGGTIAATTAEVCNGDVPGIISNTLAPSGQTGILEYKWQMTTVSPITSWDDISSSNSEYYQPGALTQTTWFRRLARTCTDNWDDAAASNLVEITVRLPFTPGEIASTGETICYNTVAGEIGSTTPAGGGDGSITYSWRSSADGYTADITGADDATHTPGTLTQTTSYRRYAKDGICNTTAEVSAGTWTITVQAQLPQASEPAIIEGVYQIATFENLLWISENSTSWNGEFVQTANIVASVTQDNCFNNGEGWLPIGTSVTNGTKFTGTYDGGNHTIDGLFTNHTSTNSFRALFGQTENAVIKNLGLTDVDITGYYAGALVAWARGSDSDISNCYASGKIVGAFDSGGLVGTLEGNLTNSWFTGTVLGDGAEILGGLVGYLGYVYAGNISQCYAIAEVEASSYVGGLVGFAYWGEIADAYSHGSVKTTDDYNGGLVGYNEGAYIDNCYSTVEILGVGAHRGGLVGYDYYDGEYTENSFWDTEASGLTTSDGGTGLLTTQMKQKSTFINAGWDFPCETANGTEDIWGINDTDNNAYPFLMWQGFENKDDVVAGTVSNDQIICYGTQPADIALTGSNGLVQWQWSIQNVSNTFADIVGAVSTTLAGATVGTLTQTTYFRALVGEQECQVSTEVVEVEVYDEFSAGEIENEGEDICYNGDPAKIGSVSPATGGDGSITYQWQSSADEDFTSPVVVGTNSATYDPPAGIAATTWYRRLAKDGTCESFTPSDDVWKVTVENTPIAGALTKTPDKAIVCAGDDVSASLTEGSGGNGTDELEYRTHDGTNWTVWTNYISGTVVSTSGLTQVEVRTRRMADHCLPSEYETLSWETELCCANPDDGGEISENQDICSGTSPEMLESVELPTGHTGDLEYKWQSSSESETTGFSDIADSDATGYLPGTLTETTWFKRLARVDCEVDWSRTLESNVVKITVEQTPVSGTLAKTPDVENVCKDENVSATLTAGFGGNGTDELEYRTHNGTDWTAWSNYISGTDVSTAGLTQLEIRSRRTADYCSDASYNTVNWQVEETPVSGTLAKSSDVTDVCEDENVSAILTAGFGGNGTDELEYRTHDGTDWTVWTNYISGTDVPTSGLTQVEIRSRRTADYCSDASYNTVNWQVEETPVSGTLAKTPDAVSICEGDNVSATLTAGSDGNGTDELEFRTNNGTVWSSWAAYTSAGNISTTGKTDVEIRSWRTATYCDNSDTTIVSWATSPQPVANAGVNATITEFDTYTLSSASAEHYTSVSWATAGDGLFSNINGLNPVYTPGNCDLTGCGTVELCLTAEAESPCTVADKDCMTLRICRCPSVVIVSPTQKEVLYGNPVTVSGTSSDPDDNVDYIEVRLNGGSWQIATGTTSWTINLDLLPGKNTLEARATDASNLKSGIEKVEVTLSIQIIEIPQGWSYISSYLEPNNPAVANMFADIVAANNLSILTGVNGIYAPAPFFINTLQNWDYTKGYKVKMHQADVLLVSGDSLPDKAITFAQGSQIIPVLTNVDVMLADLFDGQTDNILYMLDLYQNKGYWPEGNIYDLNKLQPGCGYLANFSQAIDVEFPPMSEFSANDFKSTPPVQGLWPIVRTANVHLISISAEAINQLGNVD